MPRTAPRPALLASINGPQDLRGLSERELIELAAQIREFLIENVSRTGGHLGPNLGVVELTIGIHRVFHSPVDTIVFDTGHQCYVHKLLTGRHDFTGLRAEGGLSGYPSRAESPHDVVESSHASSSLAWADGISWEKHRRGDRSWTVAVIGDGALTGGMAWEALNSISASPDRRVMVVVNDNGRSYAPTIGGLARHLDALRTSQGYERALAWGKQQLLRGGGPGRVAYDALHGLKSGIKDALIPQAMFEDLGLKYLGPVDGHSVSAVEEALARGASLDAPVLVHVITQKGRGYVPAEEDIADRFHAVGPIHPETGLPVAPARFGWTSVFADEIVRIARERDDVVGVTAAMMRPVGLGPLHEAFPGRVIDVGIAEQEAAACAAGMAYEGAHPVVALYATFLNRAFDQVLMDVALHRAGVTVVLDRAGITGTDGASHNGVWDMAVLGHVPGLRLAAPRDEESLRSALRLAVSTQDGPTVVRYPKGSLPAPLPALRTLPGAGDDLFGVVDVLSEGSLEEDATVLVVAVGPMATACVQAARRLRAQGTRVRVLAPRWVIPVPRALVAAALAAPAVLVVEDGLADGGVGSQLRDAVDQEARARQAHRVPLVTRVGVPRQFVHTATREQVLADCGMDVAGILASARDLARRVADGSPAPQPALGLSS